MAKYALEHGHSIQLIGFGERRHIFPHARGVDKLSAILDLLARVNDDGEIPYPQAIAASADLLRDGGQVILFVSSSAQLEDYAYSLGLLKAKRIKPMVVFWNEGSFPDPTQKKVCWDNHRLSQEMIGNTCPVYFGVRGTALAEIFG